METSKERAYVFGLSRKQVSDALGQGAQWDRGRLYFVGRAPEQFRRFVHRVTVGRPATPVAPPTLDWQPSEENKAAARNFRQWFEQRKADSAKASRIVR